MARGSVAVGVELIQCWYDSACNYVFVLDLYDVGVRSHGHVLFLNEKHDFSHFFLLF
jgi:hypothetical protein